MEKDRLSRWLSIGANFAVLLGLIFVALEVRETLSVLCPVGLSCCFSVLPGSRDTSNQLLFRR